MKVKMQQLPPHWYTMAESFSTGQDVVVWDKGEVPPTINRVPVVRTIPSPEVGYTAMVVAGRLADAVDHARGMRELPGLTRSAFICMANFANAALEARQLVAAFKDFVPEHHVLVAKVWWKKFGCATWVVLVEAKQDPHDKNQLWKFLHLHGVRQRDIQV
jgi:hypothetical protein